MNDRNLTLLASAMQLLTRNALPFLILVLMAASIGCDANVSTLVDAERDRKIDFKIWLPKTRQNAPLILISHGAKGHYSDHRWLVEKLVAAGYAVAALNHPADTRRDQSPEGVLRVWDRPPDVSSLITHILASPRWHSSIDPSRIAVVGFSSGGHTAISLAGGIYDPQLMYEYCLSDQRGPDCDLAEDVNVDFSNAGLNFQDKRISAVIALAPALGPGMSKQGLARISVPVLVMAAEDDELVTPEHHARHYGHSIPDAQLLMIPRGGHFVFLSCGLAGRVADYFIDEFDLCGRDADIDRESVQTTLAQVVVEFLDGQLPDK